MSSIRATRAIEGALITAGALTLLAIADQRLLRVRVQCNAADSTNDPGMRVEVFDPERALSSRREDGTWVWSFALAPRNGATRLISRNRIRVQTAGERVGMPVMELGSLVMERKMLYGIKERAERVAVKKIDGACQSTIGSKGNGRRTHGNNGQYTVGV
jgi:hypothetical protein